MIVCPMDNIKTVIHGAVTRRRERTSCSSCVFCDLYALVDGTRARQSFFGHNVDSQSVIGDVSVGSGESSRLYPDEIETKRFSIP
jgi:hypothetical protein